MDQKRSVLDWPLFRIFPAAWCMATIWWLSDQERISMPPGLSAQVWSIIGHFGMYGLLGIAAWWALGMNSRLLEKERTLYAIGIATLYGVLDEFHQSFVPGRDSDPMDVLVDFTGATLAVLIIPRVVERLTR